MISPCTDVRTVNMLVNHDDIRPFVGGGGEGLLDMRGAVLNERNVFLLGEHGGFAFSADEDGDGVEVHTMIKKSGRGQWARDAARRAISYANSAGHSRIWTKINPKLANVAAFAVEMGMQKTSESDSLFGETFHIYEMDI